LHSISGQCSTRLINRIAVNQAFPPRLSPRPRDRSHERLPHDSIEQVYVRRRRSPRNSHSQSPPLEKGLPRLAAPSHHLDSCSSSPRGVDHSSPPLPEKGLSRLAARSHHSDSSEHSPRPRSQRSDRASNSPRHVRFDGGGISKAPA
jgi:hypothetical protein